MSHLKGILKVLLVLTSVVLLSSYHFCDEAFPQGSPAKQLDFALSASGLPDKGMWKCTPAIADLNKDGHLDIIAMPRLGKGAQVFLGNGKGEWADSSQGLEMPSSCGGGVAVGDINKDGFQDLAVADQAQAEDLLFSGRSITADEALRIGLVTAVAEDPDQAALDYFDQHLAPLSASTLRFAVRAARAEVAQRIKAKLAVVEKMYVEELMATHDAVEGLTAFVGKRPAVWQDR